MADELQIQQGQTNSGAYALTGAAVGGIGAGVGAHYLTKPKYASYEDIIKDAKDSADFSSNIEKAEGEQKTFLQAAKDVADEKGKAEKAWDEGFKAFQETHKEVIQDNDEVKSLLEKQAEYQKTITDLEAKAGTASNVVTEKVKKDPLAAIRQNTKKLNEASEELKALKASGASKESIDAVNNRIKNYETRLENIYQAVIEAKGLKGDEAKALKAELQGYAQDYMSAHDRFTTKTPAHGYTVVKENLAREQKGLENALEAFKNATAKGEFKGYDLSSVADNKHRFFQKVNTIIKAEENKVKALEKMLEKFNETSGTKATTFLDRLMWLISGKNLPEGEDKKAIEEFIKGLSDKDKKLLQGKEVTVDNLKELINESKNRVKTIRTEAVNIARQKNTIKSLEIVLSEKEKAVVKKYGKGAYINNEGMICKGGKVIGKAPTMDIPEFKSASNVELPREIEFEQTRKSGGVSRELHDARANLENITKEIETKRAGLPKTALSEAEQLAQYAKEKGYADRNAFVQAQVKEKTEKFAKDFESQFKRKFGFAEHANWKIAGVAAAGALVLGGLASLVAPKNKA